MTVAVCYKCGEFKFGAFLPCKKCGTRPESEEDRAVSLVITDHYFPQEKLEAISTDLKNGKLDIINPDQLKILVEEMRLFSSIMNETKPKNKKPWWKPW